MDWKDAAWKKGHRTVRGRWYYYHPSDRFTIELDSRDRTTGRSRVFSVYGADRPEFNGWKLIPDGMKEQEALNEGSG